MWTLKKKIYYAFYIVLASWLPISQRSKLAKKMRYLFAKHICSLGKNVNIERHSFFTPELVIGDNSGIGINSEMHGPVIIGKNVMMVPNVVIYTSGHKFDRIDIPLIEQGKTEPKPVIIDDNCWIGRRVIIMPGVHIGQGCVIGTGAAVTKNVPDFCIVGGVPAKLIRKRE